MHLLPPPPPPCWGCQGCGVYFCSLSLETRWSRLENISGIKCAKWFLSLQRFQLSLMPTQKRCLADQFLPPAWLLRLTGRCRGLYKVCCVSTTCGPTALKRQGFPLVTFGLSIFSLWELVVGCSACVLYPWLLKGPQVAHFISMLPLCDLDSDSRHYSLFY